MIYRKCLNYVSYPDKSETYLFNPVIGIAIIFKALTVSLINFQNECIDKYGCESEPVDADQQQQGKQSTGAYKTAKGGRTSNSKSENIQSSASGPSIGVGGGGGGCGGCGGGGDDGDGDWEDRRRFNLPIPFIDLELDEENDRPELKKTPLQVLLEMPLIMKACIFDESTIRGPPSNDLKMDTHMLDIVDAEIDNEEQHRTACETRERRHVWVDLMKTAKYLGIKIPKGPEMRDTSVPNDRRTYINPPTGRITNISSPAHWRGHMLYIDDSDSSSS